MIAYTPASEVLRVYAAVGTGAASTDRRYGYSLNGKVGRVTDGEGNRTTFAYDGFDRLYRVRYPVPAQGQDASSSTDYEQYRYDANGNVRYESAMPA